MNKEILKRQVECFKDLFLMKPSIYILQTKEGYTYSSALKYNTILTDEVLESHLQKRKTIGVFSQDNSSKLICFDVDMKEYCWNDRVEIVNKIKEEINNFGINNRFIEVSYSGNKGFHIYIFLDKMVAMNRITEFYEYILHRCCLTSDIVELRPLPNMGMKLPLSRHLKTNNICSFVDDNFNFIKDPLYVESILSYRGDYFEELVDELKIENYDKFKDIRSKMISSKFKMLSMKEMETLDNEGIPFNGFRNQACTQLGIYYNTLGLNKDESLERLNSWISNQSKDKYKTNLNRCYKENLNILDWVYKKDIRCSSNRKLPDTIKISNSEVETLLGIRNIKYRGVALSLLVHSKIYKNERGEFYMTYQQIIDNSNAKGRDTVKKAIDFLDECDIIEIVSRNIKDKSNQYRVLFTSKRIRNVHTIISDYESPYTELLPLV